MRKMSSLSLLLVFSFMLGACMADKRLSTDMADTWQGRSLALRVMPAPPLSITTPAKAMAQSGGLLTGVVGAMLMEPKETADLAKKFGVPNPAATVAEAIADDLRRRHGLQRAGDPASADLVLESRINLWEVHYGSLQWASYAPYLQLQVRLRDRRSGKTLAAGSCKFLAAQTPRRSYKDMLANDGALLKQDMATLTQKCIAEVRKSMF